MLERFETLLDDVDDEAFAEVAARLSVEWLVWLWLRMMDDVCVSCGNEVLMLIECLVMVMGWRDLEFWGVSEFAREAFAAKGVRELYSW